MISTPDGFVEPTALTEEEREHNSYLLDAIPPFPVRVVAAKLWAGLINTPGGRARCRGRCEVNTNIDNLPGIRDRLRVVDLLPTARRAVECPRWRVLAGMLMRHGEESIRVHGPDEGLVVPGDGAQRTAHFHLRYVGLPPRRGVWLPDMADEATVGCLLGLVREVYPGCHAEPNGAGEGADEAERANWWCVYQAGGRLLPGRSTGATEAEALVNALAGAA